MMDVMVDFWKQKEAVLLFSQHIPAVPKKLIKRCFKKTIISDSSCWVGVGQVSVRGS